ncbi:MAG: ABC transporter ATP-binding protein [Alphaproteobacteria bacterium]
MAELKHELTLRALGKRYGAAAAVDAVDLTIGRGEFVTLLGPSGSGKTTLLMMIAGFVEPSAGDILLDGRPITPLPPERRQFGMVFQGYALFPHLSVADNVAFPLKVRGMARGESARRVAEAIALVKLEGLERRLPRELSGGQQQRVALARALVFRPHLLLLDEPLSALDKKLRGELQVELKSLHQRVGLTFIYVTHDQEEALSMSDRVAILHRGKLVQVGTPDELYERPATRFVADFLGRSNFIHGRVVERQAGGFRYSAGGHGFVQAGSAAPGQAEDVLIALRPEKIAVVADGAPAGANTLPGLIESWSYHGTSFQLVVATEALGPLQVQVPAWRCRFQPAGGLAVKLGWDADASIRVVDDGI